MSQATKLSGSVRQKCYPGMPRGSSANDVSTLRDGLIEWRPAGGPPEKLYTITIGRGNRGRAARAYAHRRQSDRDRQSRQDFRSARTARPGLPAGDQSTANAVRNVSAKYRPEGEGGAADCHAGMSLPGPGRCRRIRRQGVGTATGQRVLRATVSQTRSCDKRPYWCRPAWSAIHGDMELNKLAINALGPRLSGRTAPGNRCRATPTLRTSNAGIRKAGQMRI